jgi:hypothetical protein
MTMTKIEYAALNPEDHRRTGATRWDTYAKDAETSSAKLVRGFSWHESKRGEGYWSTVHEALIEEVSHFRSKATASREEFKRKVQPRFSHYFEDGESSLIRAIAWRSSHLHVTFRNGSTFEYQGVPKAIFDRFVSASSPGKFFNSQVKGQYVQHYKAA